MKKYTLDQVKDRFIGEKVSPEREEYELELRLELASDTIRKVRQDRNGDRCDL
ncbi:MAG: hypothetical protein AAF599_14520 [Bacteroidota bacterium]